LEARTGRTAAEIADSEGLDRLHRLEAEIAMEALASTEPAVVSPAASVVEVDAVRAALAGHAVVWLAASAAHHARAAVGKDHRPLLDGDPLALFRAPARRAGPAQAIGGRARHRRGDRHEGRAGRRRGGAPPAPPPRALTATAGRRRGQRWSSWPRASVPVTSPRSWRSIAAVAPQRVSA